MQLSRHSVHSGQRRYRGAVCQCHDMLRVRALAVASRSAATTLHFLVKHFPARAKVAYASLFRGWDYKQDRYVCAIMGRSNNLLSLTPQRNQRPDPTAVPAIWWIAETLSNLCLHNIRGITIITNWRRIIWQINISYMVQLTSCSIGRAVPRC
jgi:hypothetical protein